MGWLHVIDSGYGVYLNKLSVKEVFNNIENLNIELTDDIIKEIYPQLNIDLFNFSYKEKVCILGMGKENPHSWYDYNIKNINEITQQYIKENILDDDYWFDIILVDSLSLLFCIKYNYPYDAFKSLMDYNGDYMLFCNATFPIKEGHESLINLTEEVYIKQINEFIKLLYPKWKEIEELDKCEEYIKE